MVTDHLSPGACSHCNPLLCACDCHQKGQRPTPTTVVLEPPCPFLNANDRPCERCVFVPTPNGQCICRGQS